MQPLAQPPTKDSPRFDDWMFRLWKRIASTAGLSWGLIDKTGSNLTDIQTRNHADLQNIPASPVLFVSDGEDGEDGYVVLSQAGNGLTHPQVLTRVSFRM